MGPKEVLALSYRKNLRSIDYDDIKGKTLKQLLPDAECGVVILFTDHSKGAGAVGHFCLLYKAPKVGIVFFDPLGLGLRNVTSVTHSRKHLQKLLERHDFHNNKIKYQRIGGDVNSCGRWVATRYNCAHFSPKEFSMLFHHRGIPGDDLVVLMTLERDLTKIALKK